jgi:penicillin-binding protein 1A
MTDLSKKVDIAQLTQIPLKQSILVYDDNGILITHHGNLQLKIKFDSIPKTILDALLATEDMHFWSHFGLNIGALAKAVLENIQNKAIVRGGSTITQQLAKNLVLQQDDSLKTKKTERKLLDIILAVRLENCLSKEQIMEHYLNRVYFGRGAYGIKAAAKLYFNKLPDELSIEEVAFLVGLIRAPSLYASNHSKALDRALHVLRRMHATKQINKQYTKAELAKLIQPVQHSKQFGLSYFVDWVVSTIPHDVTKSQQPILVYTTINQNLQQKVIELIPKIKAKSRFKKINY